MKAISTCLLASSLVVLAAMTAPAAEEAKPAAPAAPAAAAPAAPAKAGAKTPEETVNGYLKAMQDQKFGDAFELVSKALKAGKSKEEWSKEQQYIVQMGEVKIFGFKVFPAAVAADGSAKVPNILKSQDKFLNQLGLDEYELYELVKEEGVWKIDNQTLVEGAERSEYFPADAASQ